MTTDEAHDADEQARRAWIDAAEHDVRATAKPYRLVPDDAPVRAWDPDLVAAVEKAGRDLVKVARAAAGRSFDRARSALDHVAAARADNWRKQLGRVTADPHMAVKTGARWLSAAAMVAEALDDWLPEDAVTDEQREKLGWLLGVRKERDEAIAAAVEAAVEAAVAEETARREAPGAWEAELEARVQDAETQAAARHAAAAADIARDSLLATLSAPESFNVCPPYEVDADGVWMVRAVEGGDPIRTRIATAPLLVTRVYTDPVGDQLVELAWRDGYRTVTGTVPRSVAKSGRTLVKLLGDRGIPIVEADARAVERYLAAIEADNRDIIPREMVARQLGWQPDGTFVTGQDTPRRVEVAFEEQRAQLAAHRPSGTLAEWQAAIKAIEPYPVPRIMLAGGFAAVLLTVLELESFALDLSGRSTGGKTVSAMIALSPWACPTEQGGALGSWRTTQLAVEKRLNLYNGLPAVLDETRAVKTEGLVDAVLYQVPMNRGTSRGGGYPSDLPWRTVLISTGEQPALSFTTHEGASARVLSLRGAPFGRDGEASARVASQVRAAVAEQFGTAGPAFVERLREETAKPGGVEELRRRHRGLAAEHRDGGDIAKRRSGPVAALRLAAELAYEWDICPLPSLDAKVWERELAAEQERDDRGAMALDIAREFVGRQEARMWTPAVHPDAVPALGWIGAYLEHKDADDVTRRTVALLPEILGEELAKRGYRLDAVRQAWTDGKLITLDSKGELIRRRVPKRLRVYEFDRAMFDGDDDQGAGAAPAKCPACGWDTGSTGHAERCGMSDAL